MSKKKNRKKKDILADHKKKGKVYIPPFIALFNEKMFFIKWIDDLLPEIVWIALLLDQTSTKQGIEIALKCAQETNRIISPQYAHSYALISDYQEIEQDKAIEIREALRVANILNILQSSLIPLVTLYSDCPLKILFDERARERYKIDVDEGINNLKRIVRGCFDRRSKQATIAQATMVYIMGMTGKISFSKDIDIGNLNDILTYPDTDESQKMASFVRSIVNSNVMPESDKSGEWCKYFWRHGYEVSLCEFPKINIDQSSRLTEQMFKELMELGFIYKDELFQEIKDKWYSSKIDLSQPNKSEILGGLIARQGRLTSSIATDYNLWSMDLGRIVLRCMVDTHITLAWLTKNGGEREYKQFVTYGLGQEKLFIEHLSSYMDESNEIMGYTRDHVEYYRDWVNSQIMTDVLPVNVGSWIKKTTREMAQESDCMQIYNLSYTPMSSVIHGMWNTIAKVNLNFCINPLHRFHRLPSLEEPPIYFNLIQHAAEVMDKSFKIWEEAMGIDHLENNASLRYLETLGSWLNRKLG